MSTCPKCQHSNAPDAEYCERCGAPLTGGHNTEIFLPNSLPTDFHGARQRRSPEQHPPEKVLVLLTPAGEKIVLPQVPTVNLGREIRPRLGMAAIDLTPYGADTAGVSRLHARIHHIAASGYFIEDCDSTNGTFINGHRILSFIPQGLAGDDVVQLGQLRLIVKFQAPET